LPMNAFWPLLIQNTVGCWMSLAKGKALGL
jgi:hypothetical protein